MKKQNIIYLAVGIIMVSLAILFSFPDYREGGQTAQTIGLTFLTGSGSVYLDAEIADSYEERLIGLMNRTYLGENNGMLFVFEQESNISFWMKNTLIPLDMIFLSGDKAIVHIQEKVQPCKENPCPTYSSMFPARYVVETNAGFAERRGIEIGDTADFELNL